MSSWLDSLPSHERQKLFERIRRSPAEYEKLREKVKGPEDLKEEMDRNELIAELKFALETEPQVKEMLKQQIEKDLREQGIEAVLDAMPDALKQALEAGQFNVGIDVNPDTHNDQIVVLPEGSVSEKLFITSSVNDQYVSQFAVSLSNN